MIINRLKKFILIIIIICIAVFIFKGNLFKPQTSADQTVKIGLIVPLTGSNAKAGASMKNGVELALKNINSSSAAQNINLELIIYDDESDPQKTVKLAKDLIFLDSAEAIIGPFNTDSLLAVRYTINSCGIPTITPTAMSDEIDQMNDYIFRNALTVEGEKIKRNSLVTLNKEQHLFLEGMNAKTIGILWQNDTWGWDMQNTIQDDFAKIDKQDQILFSTAFNLGETNFRYIYEYHKDNWPDLIYIISSGSESKEIVRQGREAGFEGAFIGESGFNYEDFDTELEQLADGCFFFSQWHPTFSSPFSDVFLKTYLSEYEETPNMFAANSYEALYFLWEGIQNSQRFIKRDNFNYFLRESLAAIRKMEGVTGTVYFDEYGESQRPLFLLQKRWDGRKIQSFIVYPQQYSEGKPKWNFDIP